jgi:uncharacterized protein RhaS with RHS repeats
VGARAYDPRTARWLQRDPIDAASGDPNLYRYCGNDPVNCADPSGLDALQNAAHFAAGWGDRLTGNLTKHIRDWLCDILGLPRWEPRDPCDEWYLAGHLVGAVHDYALTRGRGAGGGALRLAKKGQSNAAEKARGGAYTIRDKQTGEVVYVGQTDNFERRRREHDRGRFPEARYEFKPEYDTDDYATRRGLEQWLYEQYNPPMNRQRPVSPRNPRRDEYKRAAEEYLRQRGIIP